MGRSFPAQDTAHYNAIYPNQHCGTQSVMTAFLIVADLLETIKYFNSLLYKLFCVIVKSKIILLIQYFGVRNIQGTNLLFAQPQIFFLSNPSGTFRDVRW